MTSMSCRRSSPCLKIIPTGVRRLGDGMGQNSSHSGFFLEAITLHLSSWKREMAHGDVGTTSGVSNEYSKTKVFNLAKALKNKTVKKIKCGHLQKYLTYSLSYNIAKLSWPLYCDKIVLSGLFLKSQNSFEVLTVWDTCIYIHTQAFAKATAYQDLSSLNAGVKWQQEFIWKCTVCEPLLKLEVSWNRSTRTILSKQVQNVSSCCLSGKRKQVQRGREKKKPLPLIKEKNEIQRMRDKDAGGWAAGAQRGSVNIHQVRDPPWCNLLGDVECMSQAPNPKLQYLLLKRHVGFRFSRFVS